MKKIIVLLLFVSYMLSACSCTNYRQGNMKLAQKDRISLKVSQNEKNSYWEIVLLPDGSGCGGFHGTNADGNIKINADETNKIWKNADEVIKTIPQGFYFIEQQYEERALEIWRNGKQYVFIITHDKSLKKMPDKLSKLVFNMDGLVKW